MCDNGTNASCGDVLPTSDVHFLTPEYISMCTTGMLIGLGTIMLNAFVLHVIRAETTSFEITQTFIRNNAVVDMIIGCLTIYQSIYMVFLYVNFRECVFRNSLICGTTLLSLLIMLGLNFEKYLKISQPYRHMYILTPTVVRVYLTTVWGFALLFAAVPHILWLARPPYVGYCRFFGVLPAPYLMCVGILTFLIIILQALVYIHIFIIAIRKILKDRRKVRPNDQGGQGTEGATLVWWKPAKVVLIIVGVNVCTLSPVGIYVLMVARGHVDYLSQDDKGIFVAFISLPCFLNSLLNPVLYSFQIPRIKQAFRSLACAGAGASAGQDI